MLDHLNLTLGSIGVSTGLQSNIPVSSKMSKAYFRWERTTLELD